MASGVAVLKVVVPDEVAWEAVPDAEDRVDTLLGKKLGPLEMERELGVEVAAGVVAALDTGDLDLGGVASVVLVGLVAVAEFGLADRKGSGVEVGLVDSEAQPSVLLPSC